MDTAFDVQDEDRFAAVRVELLRDFTGWAGDIGSSADAGDASTLLDWKFSYADGRLTTWTIADLHEFALSWCPRKLSMPADDAEPFLHSVGEFFVFLAARGRLGAGSAGPEQLRRWCQRHVGAFVREMADPANFGMAKSLFAGVGGLDGTPRSQAELEALLERAGSLGPGDLEAMLGPPPPPMRLGPIRRPNAGEKAAAARVAPVLDQLGRLHAFCGSAGRTLTSKGNLRLADARELTGLLATGDLPEGVVPQVQSAQDLPVLDWLLRTALRARVVRRQRGRLVRVAAWTRLDRVEAFDRVVDAALVEGIDEYGAGAPRAAEVAEVLTDGTAHLMVALLASGAGSDADVPLVDVLDEVADALTPVGSDLLRRVSVSGLHGQIGRLERLGLLVRRDAEQDTVRLTAAGVDVFTRVFEDIGVEVEQLPDPGTASAAEMLDLVERVPLERWTEDMRTWTEARPDAGVTDFATALCEPERKVLATLSALDAVFEERAVTVVEALIGGRWDGVAAMWLADRGRPEYAEADPRRALAAVVDLLAATLDAEGPEEAVGVLTGADAGKVDALLDDAWRLDHERVAEVLEVLGRHHPDRARAKRARRSLAKYRSRAPR